MLRVIKAQLGDMPCISCGQKSTVKLMFFRGVWEIGPTFCNRCRKIARNLLDPPFRDDVPSPRTTRKEFDTLFDRLGP